MRILHVVPTYMPAVRYGGPIYSVHALCRALVARGHSVHVYTTNVDGPGVSQVSLTKPAVLDGVEIRYFPCGLGRRLYRSPAMGRAIERNVASFDILHLHSVFLWPTLAAARAADRANVPYVLAPRGMLVAELIRGKNRLLKTAWIELFERRNVAGAAAVHVTSALEQTELAKLGIPARHVAVVANGIEPPDPTRPCQAGAAARRLRILSLGRLSWKKGLDRLLRAMTHVQNAELLIAGNDDENYRPRLESMARALGLAERVLFSGPVHGDEKWNLIRSAAVFALPSYSESFGVAALEAAVCGCPVVLTPAVGVAQAIGEAGAGIVVDGDAERLGAALSALISDPARRSAMGAAGRKLAAENYSWPRIAAQTEQVYERCTAEWAKRARADYSGHPHV